MKSKHIIFKENGLNLDGYTTSDGYITTDAINCIWMSWGSVQVNCPSTGSPVGSFQLYGSNTYERNRNGVLSPLDVPANWNWTAIKSSVAVSGATNSLIQFSDGELNFRWIKGVYQRTSGTITLTVMGQLSGPV